MSRQIDTSDIPPVSLEQLLVPMRAAIANGQGLALLNGMSEAAIRDIETVVWKHFAGAPRTRLAVALRFRALLDVFRARRLKQLFLMNGFKLIARAVHEAANQRLNAEFGFNAHKFVLALATGPTVQRHPAQRPFEQVKPAIAVIAGRAA
ncbi:MAG: hypothetical protein JNL45_01415 [Hyphomicrobium sp.]|jgi:hypothetical protein|nr:hypothetical protein [Hyphomicrobium sp.]